jgi:nucleotide-binding universal stress UspA family protein
MKSILVPTDFSPTAKNAAMYALQLAQQLGIKRVVLYHSYEIPVTVDPLMPGIQMLDIESLKVNSGKSLEIFNCRSRLLRMVWRSITSMNTVHWPMGSMTFARTQMRALL